MDLFKRNILLSILLVSVALTGCGGGSSKSDDDTGGSNPSPGTTTPKNVAAAANGAMVTSSYSGNESFVIDGDTSTTNFWQGGAEGDEVKITFDKSYAVSHIKLYTNNTSISLMGGVQVKGFRVLLSDDDTNYAEVNIYGFGAGSISCSSSSIGSGAIECELQPNQTARFIKIKVTADFATTELYEVEATGS